MCRVGKSSGNLLRKFSGAALFLVPPPITSAVGDLVRTVIVDCARAAARGGLHHSREGGRGREGPLREQRRGGTVVARLPRRAVLPVAIRPGDVIVGLASFGQATCVNPLRGFMGSKKSVRSAGSPLPPSLLEDPVPFLSIPPPCPSPPPREHCVCEPRHHLRQTPPNEHVFVCKRENGIPVFERSAPLLK